MTVVADQGRVNMFVSPGVFLNRGDMQPAFMGKGAFADERCTTIRRTVQPFIEHPGNMGELRNTLVTDADIHTHFQLQVGNQRDDIGIAAALSQPVQGALNLSCTGAHGGQ